MPFAIEDKGLILLHISEINACNLVWFNYKERAAGLKLPPSETKRKIDGMKKQRSQGRFYATLEHNGTEDEITIRRPNGDQLAVIQFWDEPDTNDAEIAERAAKHIIAALNAYENTLRLPRRKIDTVDDDDLQPF